MSLSTVRLAACALLAAAAAGCADRNPLTGDVPAGPAPGPLATQLRCTVDVRGGTMACAVSPPTGARGNLLLGGQDVYVNLRSSALTPGAGGLSANVSLQNLLSQPMGTSDGITPAPGGVRVFFASGPTATGGTGSVTVQNPDGIGVFTASGQPYFQYDGILGPGATSAAKPWRFQLDPGVTTFSFGVYVSAPMPLENGWIDLWEPNPVLAPGQSTGLSPQVFTGAGTWLEDAAVTYASSNDAVATVSADGRVTGVALGTATITATSGTRTGTTRVTVADVDGTSPAITGFTLAPNPVNAGDSVTVSVTATDAGTGVTQVTVNVRASAGSIFRPTLACLAVAPSSGTRANGTFTCKVQIPPGTVAGTWNVTSVFVPDLRGNLRQLSAAGLAAAGFPSQFTVVDATPDNAGPVVTGYTVTPTTITAPDSVTVTVTATDAGTGIASVTPSFEQPPSGPEFLPGVRCSTTTPVAGTANSGTFTCRIGFPPGILPGAWWGQVRLIDRTGNTTFANTAAYPNSSLGYVNVTTPARDITPPTLRGISMPATAAPGDPVTLTIATADAGTGVDHAYAFLQSQVYHHLSLIRCDSPALSEGTAAFGAFQCTFALPAVAGTGTWTLVEVDVVDRTGNLRYAPNGVLQALGYPTTLVVTP
jgi:Bacterial Ig-like domain (group 2)/Bacterial Ig domain